MGREAARCSTNHEFHPAYIEKIDSPDDEVLAIRPERLVILVQCFHRTFEESWIEPLTDCFRDNRDSDLHRVTTM